MKVNGKAIPLSHAITVAELLAQQGFDPTRVAVERNGEIVPRAEYGQTALLEDDVLEIVSFVGGG